VIPPRDLIAVLNPASDFDTKKGAVVRIATSAWEKGWDAALEELMRALVVAQIRSVEDAALLIEGMKSKAPTVRRDDDSQGTLPSDFVSTDGREVVEGGSAGG
jgi:hypothetical protein